MYIDSKWEASAEHRELSSVLCDDLRGGMERGGREAREGGDVCTHAADSLCCTVETNRTL